MKPISVDLYKKIVSITNQVKENFRRKGIVIPKENKNGTINVGHYTIAKTKDGFYEVLDYAGNSVVDQINLPQTAIMIANNLALGKFLDRALIDKDRQYGYALFEEQLETALAKRNSSLDLHDLRATKAVIAKGKKEVRRREIEQRFEKLRNLV